jgi:hypothetical protein
VFSDGVGDGGDAVVEVGVMVEYLELELNCCWCWCWVLEGALGILYCCCTSCSWHFKYCRFFVVDGGDDGE